MLWYMGGSWEPELLFGHECFNVRGHMAVVSLAPVESWSSHIASDTLHSCWPLFAQSKPLCLQILERGGPGQQQCATMHRRGWRVRRRGFMSCGT